MKILKQQLLYVVFLGSLNFIAVSSSKVTWAPDLQNERFGVTPNLPLEHRQDKLEKKQRKNLQRLVTFDEMAVFNNMADEQLQKAVEDIIPLPEALNLPIAQLYQQVAVANPENLAQIFDDTAFMAGNVSIDIFQKFFNVVCLNEEILQQYTTWLYARLIPVITQILNNRVKKIQENIKMQHEVYLAMLQTEEEKYSSLVAQQEKTIDRAVQNEITTLAVIPVVAYAQSRLYESPVIRLISYAAFAGLTIKMLNQYSQIMQKVASTKNQNLRFKQIVAKTQAQAQALQLPEIKVVDEVTGRLVREFYERIKNFAQYERDRFKNDLERIEEQKRLLLQEALDEEQSVTLAVPVAKSASVLQNPVVRAALRLTKSLQNLADLVSQDL